jgi:Flp pilus assembly pilin Flp
MIHFISAWLQLKSDQLAVTALEYGLIAGIIVATLTLGFNVLMTSESSKFISVGSSL